MSNLLYAKASLCEEWRHLKFIPCLTINMLLKIMIFLWNFHDFFGLAGWILDFKTAVDRFVCCPEHDVFKF